MNLSQNRPAQYQNEPQSAATQQPATAPCRLHWSSILFDVLSLVRTFIVPAIIVLLGAARGNTVWLVVAAIVFVTGLFFSIFRFVTLSYQIEKGQLIVKQGLLFRTVRSVPVERIQNIDFVQSLLHRLFGVAEVRVETAAGAEPEAALRVLKLQQVEELRAEIFANKRSSLASAVPDVEDQPTAPASLTTANQTAIAAVPLLSIPASWLMMAGLASNRGMVLVGVVFGAMHEFNWLRRVDFEGLQQFVPQNLDRWAIAILSTVAFISLLVLLRILSMIWYLIRFFDYQLILKGEDLQVSCGLFTKVQATIPRRRIQFISVQRNLIMRWLRLSRIRIETASNGASHEDATQSVSSHWFVPIIADSGVAHLIGQLKPGLVWNEAEFNLQPVSPRGLKRRLRVALFISLVLAIGGTIPHWLWGVSIGSISLVLLCGASILFVRSLRYGRNQQGVVFRSGFFTVKTSMTFFEKIQAISLLQSPLDRRWKMATLSVDTAAAGPADHIISIPLMDIGVALQEELAVKQLAASHQPSFR
jgi:putative membrane protein